MIERYMEVCRRNEDLRVENYELKEQLAKMTQAVGLASTALPHMEIDVDDPIGMMQQLVERVKELEEAL